MPRLNQKGVAAQLLILLLVAAGIGTGLYLVQHPQIFKPKAGGGNINWIQSTNNPDPDNCVYTDQYGKTVTSCPKVKFQIYVPEVVSQ